jgi:hypothetical protein
MNANCKSSTKIAIGITVIVFLLIAVSIFNWIQRLQPFEITSSGAVSVNEKVKRLDHRIAIVSKVEEIEYKCSVRPSMIGPSRHDYLVAVKVEPAEVSKWLVSYHLLAQVDGKDELSRMNVESLNLSEAIWHHTSTPKIYINGTKKIIAFHPEGILFMHLSN